MGFDRQVDGNVHSHVYAFGQLGIFLHRSWDRDERNRAGERTRGDSGSGAVAAYASHVGDRSRAHRRGGDHSIVSARDAMSLALRSIVHAGRSPMIEFVKRDRSTYKARRTSLDAREAIDGTTSEERVRMVWALTREAWTFKDGHWDEPRLRRDVGRVIRRRS